MFQKGFNVSLSFCVVKLLVEVKSILRRNVINNGVLYTKNISIVRNTSLLSFKIPWALW